jgi:hypothetical protein
MKFRIVSGVTAALIAGGLISAAPPAAAGCLYGGWMAAGRCDGPVQPDGTWQRCVVFNYRYKGLDGSPSNFGGLAHRCDQVGPDLHPWGAAFNSPPTHIDD